MVGDAVKKALPSSPKTVTFEHRNENKSLLSTNVTFVILTLTLFNLGSRIMDRLVDFF